MLELQHLTTEIQSLGHDDAVQCMSAVSMLDTTDDGMVSIQQFRDVLLCPTDVQSEKETEAFQACV